MQLSIGPIITILVVLNIIMFYPMDSIEFDTSPILLRKIIADSILIAIMMINITWIFSMQDEFIVKHRKHIKAAGIPISVICFIIFCSNIGLYHAIQNHIWHYIQIIFFLIVFIFLHRKLKEYEKGISHTNSN